MPLPYHSLIPGFLPASLLSPKASGRYGVYPLCMVSSIAAMPTMRVNAHHAKRQVYQPGLSLLSKTKSFYRLPPGSAIIRPSIRQTIILPWSCLKQFFGTLWRISDIPF